MTQQPRPQEVFTRNKYGDSRIAELVSEERKGTCVIMELSNFSNKNSQDVFDGFADVNGGFTKTKLPLKNIFDDPPVSRSQAKHICNRLEDFKEVVVDFADVTWMGQGFAHQLFVVFANNHPEISVIPINMNEDVTKMYSHVMAGK